MVGDPLALQNLALWYWKQQKPWAMVHNSFFVWHLSQIRGRISLQTSIHILVREGEKKRLPRKPCNSGISWSNFDETWPVSSLCVHLHQNLVHLRQLCGPPGVEQHEQGPANPYRDVETSKVKTCTTASHQEHYKKNSSALRAKRNDESTIKYKEDQISTCHKPATRLMSTCHIGQIAGAKNHTCKGTSTTNTVLAQKPVPRIRTTNTI